MQNSDIINIPEGKKIYFASDFHLGIPDSQSSLEREKKLVRWLESIRNDAHEIFLMGDIFDFWYEYKTVVPKGYVRFLGKITELIDSGIPIHIFRGNHDIWAFDYLKEECGVKLYRRPVVKTINQKTFFLTHGDGLGPGDTGYKFLKKVFEFRLNQWLFKWLHPDIGTRMGLFFSRRSRLSNEAREHKRPNGRKLEELPLWHFATHHHSQHPEINYYIFGHNHLMKHASMNNTTEFILLGDWMNYFSYAVFNGKKLELKQFEG